ncbi:MAG: ATP-binding protein [Desulfobacula sp.]|nr:ATP-binding protein [Desulfobacula sp.]
MWEKTKGIPELFSFHLSLKSRVYLVNAVLLGITLVGAVLMVWYTYKIENVFKTIISRNVVIFESAEALGTDLVNQKGYVTYFFQDGKQEWLVELARYRTRFENTLEGLKAQVKDTWEIKTVYQIEADYRKYIAARDEVIELYKKGDREKGFSMHQDVRQSFFEILELCNQFKDFHKEKIETAIEKSSEEANRLRIIALMAIVSVTLLSLLVNFIFARHIMEPIRKLISQVSEDGTGKARDEVDALQRGVLGLLEDAEETHQKLRQSQVSLLQSEKMALIGRLAAGTAHSIRNPLTSVKMRLFSLNRSAALSNTQRDDLNVISGEIIQINKIVENFLEFARPPKLIMKRMSPSTVVDSAVYLLDQRLRSYHVNLKIERSGPLSETLIDPEQLKEVLVNIIINACEAMQKGGNIMIREQEVEPGFLQKADVIRISDNGEGMTEEIMKNIFDPFFTTKEEGTGLGLSIAYNIIHEHGGTLEVSSQKGRGTDFIIMLPIREKGPTG